MLGLLNVFECMHIYSGLLCSLSIVWEWGKPGNLEMCMDWIQSFSTWSRGQCVPCFYFSQWQRRYCYCFCNTFDVRWFNGMFMRSHVLFYLPNSIHVVQTCVRAIRDNVQQKNPPLLLLSSMRHSSRRRKRNSRVSHKRSLLTSTSSSKLLETPVEQ